MSQVQTIENELHNINDAVFQELCDCLLYEIRPDLSAFERKGSVLGKQKTRKGTPDTFVLLPNGNFIYSETTTDGSNKQKLRDDIEACFNPKKSTIDRNKIETIYLFFNFRIGQNEIDKIVKLAQSFNQTTKIEFYSIDRITQELLLNYKHVASQYFNISLDRGQVVSVEQFVKQYNSNAQSIATPLDNPFIQREEDKQKLKSLLQENNFILLTGSAGIGKTRLAVETIREFVQENTDFKAYCISYKHAELFDDLNSIINKDDKVILLVDDAFRINHFEQIIGFYKNHDNLKIIATLRDYAVKDFTQRIHSLDLDFEIQKLEALSPDSINNILDSFDIKNDSFRKRIIEISAGNPRLTLMAIKVALDKKNIKELYNLDSLFEQYFQRIFADNKVLSKTTIQYLGIIAFFNKLPIDKGILEEILDKFSLEYNDFISTVDTLLPLEILSKEYEYLYMAPLKRIV